MIHDTLEKLSIWSPAIQNLEKVPEMLAMNLEIGSHILSHMTVHVSEQATSFFDGTFRLHPQKVCLFVTLHGEQTLATSYRKKDTIGKRDDKGFISITDSEPTDVLLSSEGMFTLFMPGEPFAYGLNTHVESKSIKFALIILETD